MNLRFPSTASLGSTEAPLRHRVLQVTMLATAVLWIWVFWRNAWICDDAFITFRSVEQMVQGHGPRWNPHERVQAFTHPLWFGVLCVVRLVSENPWWNAIVLSFLLSSTALITVARRSAPRPAAAVLLVALAVSSKAFVDYSSSGLETPLVCALLAVFLGLLARSEEDVSAQRLSGLVFVGSLLLLCRHDLLLVVAPPIAVVLWQARKLSSRRLAFAVTIGSLPFLAWTVFSVIYYGFPFPNTAYAKLSTGVPAFALWRQGQWYLMNAVRWDPVTAAVCIVGAIALLRERRPTRVALGTGMTLYLLYVIKVGGDFMAGRFFVPLFFLGLATLVPRLVSLSNPRLIAILLTLAGVNAVLPGARLAESAQEPLHSYRAATPDEHGIADEKKSYSGRNAFSGLERQTEAWRWQNSSQAVRTFTAVGWTGYNASLETILVDEYALTDPLLARLPCNPTWRIGHYSRTAPAGYVESLEKGSNELRNPFVRELYEDIMKVTRGPLFTLERWRAIYSLNFEYRRPACQEPPCRLVHWKVLPLASRKPILHPGEGELLSVQVSGSELRLSGWLPDPTNSAKQEILILLTIPPKKKSVETQWSSKNGESPAQTPGFRITLSFESAEAAAEVAESLCMASSTGEEWRALASPLGRCQELLFP